MKYPRGYGTFLLMFLDGSAGEFTSEWIGEGDQTFVEMGGGYFNNTFFSYDSSL